MGQEEGLPISGTGQMGVRERPVPLVKARSQGAEDAERVERDSYDRGEECSAPRKNENQDVFTDDLSTSACGTSTCLSDF